MLQQKIKVFVQTTVAGPDGSKLRAGTMADLEDNSYTRLLIKSGTVSLIDPPSLDADFLEKGEYELKEGVSYDDLKEITVKEETPKKVGKRTKAPKKIEPVEPIESKEQQDNVAPEENFQEEAISKTEGSAPDDGSYE